MPQYNGVWTLEAQAQAQSNQQWVTDPNFRNTTLLLQADGTGSGSQNNTFLDGSTNNFFITRNGNTTQGSFTPFSPGWNNNFVDSSASYLTDANTTRCVLGSGTFCIEAWVYNTSYRASGNILFANFNTSTGANGLACGFNSAGVFNAGENSGVTIISGGAVPLNTWTHIAFVRDSSSFKNYINGVQTATSSTNFSKNYTSGKIWVGSIYPIDTLNNGYAFTGLVSNLRVTVGSPVYTSQFTPSTVPFTASVGSTKVLTCQSNRFIDNSGNSVSLSAASSVSVQTFAPFAPQYQWTPSVIGGSGYFDGTTDALRFSANSAFALGTGAWTMEAWVYPTAFGANRTIMAVSGSGGQTDCSLYVQTNGGIVLSTTSSQIFNTDLSFRLNLNSWQYIVVTRNASNGITLYVNGATITTATMTQNTTSNQFVVGDAWAGYIADARLVKGQALATVSPPTTPTTLTSGGITASNVSMLCNFTNAGIYDGKMANNYETVSTAQVATSPVKYGSGSMKFNGTSDYLASFNNVPMGTGDCTIEAWVYPTYTGSGAYAIFTTGPGGTANNLRFGVNASTLYLDILGAAVFGSTGPTIPTNVWVHMAVTRANGVWRGFINGVLMGTTTTQGTASITGTERYIGLLGPTGAAGNTPGGWWSGYIDDLRVTQGVARYISNFTPPQQALPRQ